MLLDNEFINKIFPQNCGDILLVIEKTTKRQNNIALFRCQFKKYPYEIFSTKQRIINGQVNNPQIEIEKFVKKEWPQNCGDIIRIVCKSNIKRGNAFLWECEFIKYPYKVLAGKTEIIKGRVINPQIEQVEFINKIWPQNCGDSLKIVKKSNKKQGRELLWECEFLNYPCTVFAQKQNIIRRRIKNPRIEEEEFINKEFPQNCGDILKVIKKTNEKQNNISLYKCKFVNYPYELLAQKSHVLEGTVLNPKIPWINKEENQVRDFIKSFYNGKVVKYSGKKEDNYYEIDIYLPELKKGIEYNGSPWHEEGNSNNKFSKPIGYHQKKQELFAKKGIEILFVWDYEWFEDFPRNKIVNKQIKQRIREFLKI